MRMEGSSPDDRDAESETLLHWECDGQNRSVIYQSRNENGFFFRQTKQNGKTNGR